MESKGMVEKTIINDNKSRYELSGDSHRHHIVCTVCQKMVPISKCPFNKLESDIEMETKFDITGHQFILYGLCPKCKKQGQ
jgi:Fur family ferric uptake transcriptional regulator